MELKTVGAIGTRESHHFEDVEISPSLEECVGYTKHG
jgi:hypothetical protein